MFLPWRQPTPETQRVKKQSQDNTTQKWLFDGWLSSMRIRMEEVHFERKTIDCSIEPLFWDHRKSNSVRVKEPSFNDVEKRNSAAFVFPPVNTEMSGNVIFFTSSL